MGMADKKEHNTPREKGTAEYLHHSSEFKKARIVVLKRAQGKCEICGSPADVVHHIDGSKSNHNIVNLISLCDQCHLVSHKDDLGIINGRLFAGNYTGTSKYRRLYGFTLSEMAAILGCSIYTIKLLLNNPETLENTLSNIRVRAPESLMPWRIDGEV